jgi:hypothetical protein
MTALIEFSGHWWAWMVPMAWQVSVLALVVWGLTAVLRKHSPHLRYWLWMLVLVRLVLPPTLSLPTGVGNVVEPPRPVRPGYMAYYPARGYRPVTPAAGSPIPHQPLLPQTVYWFNPFVLLANLRIRAERELIVDDAVLSNMAGLNHIYGDSLLKVVADTPRKWTVAPGLVGIGEDGAGVQERVLRIADTERGLHLRLGLVGALLLVVVAAVLIPQARGEGWLSVTDTSVPTDASLQGVPPLEYVGPKANAFAQAVDNILQHLGEKPRYEYYVSMSASAFRPQWSTDAYYQLGSSGGPDFDTEFDDNAAMIQATGWTSQFLGNRDFHSPLEHSAIGSRLDNAGIRRAATESIGKQGRAVVALMELSNALGWRILTGYEQKGAVVVGWPGIEPDRPASIGDST